jgi:hypothetical protein
MQKSPAAIALLLLAAVLAPANTSAQAPTRGIPAGSYTTTLSAKDVVGRVKSTPADSLVGNWTMTFDDAGHFAALWNGKEVVAGTTVPQAGNRVYFDENDTGPYACHAPATYTYTVRGDRLTLRKVDDRCNGRVAVLASHPFTRRR